MTFDYSIKPCSSAQPVKDSSGNVIQPIRYNGVGCPAVILNNNNTLLCSNGDTFNSITGKAGSPPNEYDNDPFTGNLTNRFNDINFNIGQTVYVENIFSTLQNIFDVPTLSKFLAWNPKLIDELANISKGCGVSSNIILKGRIAAITRDVFMSGRLYWGTDLYRNMQNYPNSWPREIFWMELFNGNNLGLDRFNVGSRLGDDMCYEEYDLVTEQWIKKFSVGTLPNFNGKQLYPVLRSQITNLQTRMLVQGTNSINRSQIMNTPRFRSRGSCTTGSLCLDTTLTPSFKNSTKNMYLAPIPYGQRLGNTFRSSQIRGSKKIIRKNCVNPQFGRLVGTGGARLVNKF